MGYRFTNHRPQGPFNSRKRPTREQPLPCIHDGPASQKNRAALVKSPRQFRKDWVKPQYQAPRIPLSPRANASWRPKWSTSPRRLCHYGPEVAEKCQLRAEMRTRRKADRPFRGGSGIHSRFFDNGRRGCGRRGEQNGAFSRHFCGWERVGFSRQMSPLRFIGFYNTI